MDDICVACGVHTPMHSDGGSVNAFLAAALTRVMRTAVPIPALASTSVLQSAAVGGSVVGVVGPLYTFGELNSWVSFDFNVSYSSS